MEPLDSLLAARWQMAVSLGFHIVFACIGMVMPFFMAAAHRRWLRTGEVVYRELARRWAYGVAIFFAVGAVSGTVLSFELGMLWPRFMDIAGPIFGLPFALEGTAFFLEAIALGLYLYGWDRLPPRVHWAAGVVVGIAGVFSGIFVVAANAWMNSPAGFAWVDGQATDIDPVAAMFNAAWPWQALHMTLAAFVATGFAVAGLHAVLLLRRPGHPLHRAALRIALPFAVVAAFLQPISGDLSAKDVARRQPEKLAAMEALFETQTRAPLLIGGLPDVEAREVRYALELPGLLSFLAFADVDAEVQGLDAFPRELWPPVVVTHLAFQVMVGIGFFLMGVALLYLWARWKRPGWLDHPRFLRLLGLTMPLGFVAVEAGWIVTEVGRQPWIIYQILLTRDAVTTMPGIWVSLGIVSLIYALLTVFLVWLMRRQIRALHARPVSDFTTPRSAS